MKVELDGSIVTMGEIDYEFDDEIVFSVQAVDSKGYVSKAVSVSIDVNNLRSDDDDDDSGSLAWLTLLAAPFAFMRRRKQK